MRPLVPVRCHVWFSSRKLAEKYIRHARHLLASQQPADIQTSISLLDAALKLSPQWDKALELKAKALLCLCRFKDIANMLHEFIPSFKQQAVVMENSIEKLKLLAYPLSDAMFDKVYMRNRCFSDCFPALKLQKKLCNMRADREQWKCLVLGQACCHLGMMEDATVLLSNGKRAASAALRRKSNRLHDDGFGADVHLSAEYDLVSHLLGNIKFLLRRRMVAIAAFEAGCYSESVKHFSKLIDGRKGAPQGFIADCCLLRAKAYEADGRIVDAIADCNQTLTLNPTCAEAFSMRSTLFESIGCLYECASDLAQAKTLYGGLLHVEVLQPCWNISENPCDADLQACFYFISSKLTAMKERLALNSNFTMAATKERLALDSNVTMDFHRVLGVSRGCSRSDAERAYLLLSLRHRPEKAANFVDGCEFVDERDMEYVKDEARNLAFKLTQLIQRAYTGIMALIIGEQMHKDVTTLQHKGKCDVNGNKSPVHLLVMEEKRSDTSIHVGKLPTARMLHERC